MKSDLELFAKKLKIIRQKRKYTLEKLAELCELTPNHISKLEAAKSNPSFSTISKLAKSLDVEIKELFVFDDLKDEEYIKDEFIKLIKYSDSKYLKLLYKIHKNLIN